MVLKGGNMLVKNILKNVITFLNINELLDTKLFGGTSDPTSEQTELINLLINATNLVCNQIASEYYPIKQTKIISTSNGMVSYSTISTTPIVDILSVKINDIDVSYQCYPTYLKTQAGTLDICYASSPSVATSISSNIDFYNYRINERVIAYGVVAEYHFINGNYDDATICDNRFKNSLNSVIRPKREIKVKERLWI